MRAYCIVGNDWNLYSAFIFLLTKWFRLQVTMLSSLRCKHFIYIASTLHLESTITACRNCTKAPARVWTRSFLAVWQMWMTNSMKSEWTSLIFTELFEFTMGYRLFHFKGTLSFLFILFYFFHHFFLSIKIIQAIDMFYPFVLFLHPQLVVEKTSGLWNVW